ncbi:uncharacterized protein H6S33_003671 [Morchella sextelata]|uniref:uncharacterized protein n=1 Tax=Morchella sextelata TaxID=1174677 RepID=UPI001D03D314|nr:uncharacterized protein H6S33_003671 [Morchella sextelata]KAH0606837.1 hypothetical protein H6S33_003671 [Morchella sextelata]
MASWLYNTLLGGDNPTPGAIRLPDSASAPSSTAPPPYTRTKSPRPRAPLSLPALDALRGKRVILASASPRRKQLLSQIGLTDIEVVPSKFAENLDKAHYTPFEYVLATATNKCADVYKTEIDNEVLGEPAIVIAADTVIVTYDGEIMEKPRSEEGHLAMLKTLRDGMPHKVYTAVVAMVPLETVVHPGYCQESHVEETVVEFDKMVTDDLLEAYVKTREGADKAGGYAIQGTGSILVKRIEGTFDNVVGLPLRGTLRIIEKAMSAEEMQEDEEEEIE